MRSLRQLYENLLDIRPNERRRVAYVFSYLVLVLFAYYILKPLSRAIFLSKLDIDKLPWLYILIAAAGGILAYFYTKLAVRASLGRAVLFATIFFVVCLVLFFFLLRSVRDAWLYYVFNIWVSLFSIVMVSQGWLIAANVFNPREAKRIYGLLGIGAILGAAFGGSFAAFATSVVGVNNQVLVCAILVLLAYGSVVLLSRLPEVHLERAKAVEESESDFQFTDILGAFRYRHLQIIVAIIFFTYVVDVLVEYQNQAMAKASYGSSQEELLKFLGSLYGIYLNFITFGLQFFLTSAVVARFGVSGTLQIMPISIGLMSAFTILSPSIISTSIVRLTEAATRYTFNRTGMELLYLPLPLDLKNRAKAFVDIFVDRFARGMGGVLLVVVAGFIELDVRHVAMLVIGFCVVTITLSHLARREYVATVRKRLESRRLDLESVRVSVSDPATLALLLETVRSSNARQATYALGLLDAAQSVDLKPILEQLVESPFPEVRGKVFEVARRSGCETIYEQALREIRSWREGRQSPSIGPAVAYALEFSKETSALASRLLDHPNETVRDSVMAYLVSNQELANQLISSLWIEETATDNNPARRRLAALAIRARPEGNFQRLIALMADPDRRVAQAAIETAGEVRDRSFVEPLIHHLADGKLRGPIVDALSRFGHPICGTLGDFLLESTLPVSARVHLARVLQRIPHQRAVDALFQALEESDLAVRSAVLRALHRLRETQPKLNYGVDSVTRQIWNEMRGYYELHAALSSFRADKKPAGAWSLLEKTIEARLRATIQRLFYLLGLRYPPREIYAAYLAVRRGKAEELSTAVEFLDSLLDRELKRVLLPLLDAPENLSERGREFFDIEKFTVETALARLLESGDEWLVCCSIAAAVERRFTSLSGRIALLQENTGAEVERMAREATAKLAA